jgi:glycosyltransferase involved in cell wall biosynthesis
MTSPYFSVIMPMFNRSMTIRRAIESCLSQKFPDFELLITDDASSDDSVAVASSYADSRIKIFRHAHNRGPCPARNTAIAHARGKWCVIVDSDFALLPGALENLLARTRNAPPEIGSVASSCLWDTGEITPLPTVPDVPLDFRGYLQWVETLTIPEKLDCFRREVFATIRYPDSRAWEFEFHMNWTRRWRLQVTRDVMVKIYTDAPNRITMAPGSGAVQRMLDDAPDKLASFERILRDHGTIMRECAPKLYNYTVALAGNQAFLTGQRRKGLKYVSTAIARHPLSAGLWGLMCLGMLLGPTATAWANVLRRQASERLHRRR